MRSTPVLDKIIKIADLMALAFRIFNIKPKITSMTYLDDTLSWAEYHDFFHFYEYISMSQNAKFFHPFSHTCTNKI